MSLLMECPASKLKSMYKNSYQLKEQANTANNSVKNNQKIKLEPQTSTPLKIPNLGSVNYTNSNVIMVEQTNEDTQKGTRFLSTKAVTLLNKWFIENRDYPYPDEATTDLLAREADISSKQVKKWFANKRVRSQLCCKPIHRNKKKSSPSTVNMNQISKPVNSYNQASIAQFPKPTMPNSTFPSTVSLLQRQMNYNPYQVQNLNQIALLNNPALLKTMTYYNPLMMMNLFANSNYSQFNNGLFQNLNQNNININNPVENKSDENENENENSLSLSYDNNSNEEFNNKEDDVNHKEDENEQDEVGVDDDGNESDADSKQDELYDYKTRTNELVKRENLSYNNNLKNSDLSYIDHVSYGSSNLALTNTLYSSPPPSSSSCVSSASTSSASSSSSFSNMNNTNNSTPIAQQSSSDYSYNFVIKKSYEKKINFAIVSTLID